ncbi:putative SLACS retrotransposable element [Trypanosoma cruzi]|uniref:Putative SLACS retrotransposable element n=1 Tax=Trypanosoma cruzi TaxID=5693 RepID=A0A2V2WHG9_TRYCR|nr:putative SLACS retrotransposable element [Trypanosoma cruzi]
MRRKQHQEKPYNNNNEMPPQQQSFPSSEEEEMGEEGVGGEEGETLTPRHATGQEDGGHPFSHKTAALPDLAWRLACGCHHNFSGQRRGEHLRSHIHAVHRKQERMYITNEALISRGLVRCDACGKFARPAYEHGQHIDHAAATTHVARKTWRHSGRSTVRWLPDHTIPRRRRVWNGHTPWNGRRHQPQTRGKTRGCRRECPRDITSTSASGPTGWMQAAQSCWDTTPRRRTNAAANKWPSWTWCDTTYDCRRNSVVAKPPAPTTTSSIKPIGGSVITTTRQSELCGVLWRPRKTGRSRSAMRMSTVTRQPTRQGEYLPRQTYTRQDAQRHAAHCRQRGAQQRSSRRRRRRRSWWYFPPSS